MSLADRLRSAQITPNKANNGCHSCQWLASLDPDTLRLINEWIEGGHNSNMQLHEILSTPGEDCADNLLPVSYTAWRMHMRHHVERWSKS